MVISHPELILRMAIGAALGGVIGYERDRHGRPVGLRTHILVSLSAATFMVLSSQFAYYQRFAAGSGIEVDASRIAASVVSAIGFLAGGAILRSGISVMGLTTAAGLWLVTAIGLCAGAGMFVESATATLFGVLALTLVRRFEDKHDHLAKKRLTLDLTGDTEAAAARAIDAVTRLGGTVVEVEYERSMRDEQASVLTLDVTLPVAITVRKLISTLDKLPALTRIHVRSQ
ncbi:MAG TPA: MgtC/SapB family protein [Polyangiales bacterium]|nr:MgtC/SapB family protein [Polyangiales bacterium]